ncbi:MAG: putative oxidoreductase [Gammaproteobacteria bacterium]|nr:putative oxidoreductase [Gammaproteobacteria bacterium]
MAVTDTTESFDYIIAGAGSAGCVLANRLSAEPGVRVALIEAGHRDYHPFIHVPAATGAAIGTASLNWRFETAPQANLKNRRLPHHRGRGLGGSSAINGMVYFRGHPLDFDDWTALGARGWSYADVLPYFKRSENNLTYHNSPWHGTQGEMAVSHIKKPNPLNAVFEAAMDSLGYRYRADFNAGDPEGYGPRQMNIRNGRRESMATAFLRPVQSRQNLTIMADTLVRRVIIEGGKAVAVEIEQVGAIRQIAVRREAILAAGAIQSPQILLLSGIGDGAQLQAMGIAVQHHLPGVGANLQDHLSAPVMMETANIDSYGLSLKALPRCAWNLVEYILFRHGALASNLFESAAFIKTRAGLDRPDLQLVYQPARKMLKGAPIPIGHGFVLNPVNLYPRSYGRLSLASPDPHAAPIIDPNLLADPADIRPLLKGIEISRRVFAAPAYARYRAVEVGPGAEITSENGLIEYIKDIAYTVNHPVSTCRMGTGAVDVVDAELRVHGLVGLRVADASIFPKMVGGNINAAVVMVAEKAADMILGRPPLNDENRPDPGEFAWARLAQDSDR